MYVCCYYIRFAAETFTIEDLSYILSNAKLGVVLSKPEVAIL